MGAVLSVEPGPSEAALHEGIPTFTPTYGVWDEARAFADWQAFADQSHELAANDIAESLEFLARAYDQWTGRSPVPSAGHAFLLPTRITTTDTIWASDTASFAPMLTGASPATRQALITRLPPFIVSQYTDSSGRAPGAVIHCPIFPDMGRSFPDNLTAIRAARTIINQTARFAERTGARLLGLGGTIPSLTGHGKQIDCGAPTTTGHAGTLALLRMTIDRALTRRHIRELDHVAVFGGGSIGMSAAIDLASLGANVSVFDPSAAARKRASRMLDGMETPIARSVNIFEDPDETSIDFDMAVGAATSTVDLGQLRGEPFLIDDSQPPCFARNGLPIAWVVGEDRTSSNFLTRMNDFAYGDHGFLSNSHVWGCEAEAASLVATERIDLCLSRPVQCSDTDEMMSIFSAIGIDSAPLQSFGENIEAEKSSPGEL